MQLLVWCLGLIMSALAIYLNHKMCRYPHEVDAPRGRVRAPDVRLKEARSAGRRRRILPTVSWPGAFAILTSPLGSGASSAASVTAPTPKHPSAPASTHSSQAGIGANDSVTNTASKMLGLRTGPTAFVGVMVMGATLNLLGAFHGNIWFDESYSLGLASKSFTDIWRIGTADVHPILYYWMLHLVYLMFGTNILAYRLFSTTATLLLALMGWTHLRPDYGERVGILFSLFVLLSPWGMLEAVDIRMYSWSALFVMLTLVYTGRIMRQLLSPANTLNVPTRWWAVIFVSALASAYTHYYAAIGACCCMLVLLAAVVRSAVMYRNRRAPCIFLGGVLACLGAYLPWIKAVASQMARVSSGYWITFSFPDTLYELLGFPVGNPTISSLLHAGQGHVWQVISLSCVLVFLASIGLACRRAHIASRHPASPALVDLPLVVFYLTIVIAAVMSLVLRRSILQSRYLSCVEAPICLGMAALLDRADSRMLIRIVTAAYLFLAILSQGWELSYGYDQRNGLVIDYYAKVAHVGHGVLPVIADEPIGDNIVAAGPLSQYVPDIPITISDSMPSYEAYAPTISLAKDTAERLSGYHGRFVLISNGDTIDGVKQYAHRVGAAIVESRTFLRPYRHNVWTISVLEL